MSKKHRAEHKSAGPGDLRPRIDRAVSDGRFQQALDLARQLYKAETTPANLQLLKDCALGRARQLTSTGHSRDAVSTLEAAQRLDEGNPAWLEAVAAELAAAGGVRQALALAEKLPPGPAVERLRARAADGAVQQEAAGRAQLPPALHADFDRVLKAFAQVEAGQDDAARETLQGIALRSPFLEWKVLLRGLQAYYADDNARALENWQRLDPERLPARLGAPLRAEIDPDFRAAQAPATQKVLHQQFERLGAPSVAGQMRALQSALAARNHSLADAFRIAEALVPELRRQAPHLVPRLAACFYWAILETGPDDVLRYKRVFGTPADDPGFHRLKALAMEDGEEEAAHREWQQYEKALAEHPERWPAGQAERARALVWLRMGRNAWDAADAPEDGGGFFGFYAPRRRHPLSPSPENCFLRAIELAPDMLDPYAELFRYHREQKQDGKAEKVARKLLARFPDHVATLEELADLLADKEKHAEALELLQRAFRANPLDRDVRGKLARVQLFAARSAALAGRLDEARPLLQSSLSFEEPPHPRTVLAAASAVEFKAGDDAKAEELLGQARARAGSALEVSWLMLAEAARLKLSKPLKTRFEKEFKDGLQAPPEPAAVIGLVGIARALQRPANNYFGAKTHAKLALAHVERARKAKLAFTEPQLIALCSELVTLDSVRAAREVADLGQEQYPQNPFFPFLLATSYFRDEELRGNAPDYRVRQLLKRADELARALPPDPRREALLQGIADRLAILDELNPFAASFDTFFDHMDADGADDFDDEDFEDGPEG